VWLGLNVERGDLLEERNDDDECQRSGDSALPSLCLNFGSSSSTRDLTVEADKAEEGEEVRETRDRQAHALTGRRRRRGREREMR